MKVSKLQKPFSVKKGLFHERPSPERMKAKDEWVTATASLRPIVMEHSRNVSRTSTISTAAIIGGSLCSAGLWFIPPTPTLALQVFAGIGAGLSLVGVGTLVAGATDKLSNWYLGKTTKPRFQEALSTLEKKELTYHNTLLAEMNDEGVSQYWKSLDKHFARSETENLEMLADGRLANGWKGRLAHLDDIPRDYDSHVRYLETKGNPESLTDLYSRELKSGKNPTLAFREVKRQAKDVRPLPSFLASHLQSDQT